MGTRRTQEETSRILLFNLTFFGTFAWLGSTVDVALDGGWWYGHGQTALALAGMVLFWIAWWLDDRGRPRQALRFALPAVATLSVWVTTVYPAL
jgi:hypothetical protein